MTAGARPPAGARGPVLRGSGGHDREARVRRVEQPQQLREQRGVAVEHQLAARDQILRLCGARDGRSNPVRLIRTAASLAPAAAPGRCRSTPLARLSAYSRPVSANCHAIVIDLSRHGGRRAGSRSRQTAGRPRGSRRRPERVTRASRRTQAQLARAHQVEVPRRPVLSAVGELLERARLELTRVPVPGVRENEMVDHVSDPAKIARSTGRRRAAALGGCGQRRAGLPSNHPRSRS